MRARAIVALLCVLLTFASACGGSAGAAAPPRDYGNTKTAAFGPSSAVRWEAGGERGAQDVVLASTGSTSYDSDGMGSGGGQDKPTPPPPAPPSGKKDEAPAEEAPAEPRVSEAAGTNPKKPATESASASAITPMLVYTARVNMAVYEVRSSLGEVESLAKSLGGFLARRSDQAITIRVPAARFDEAIKRIEKLGDMLSRDVEVEDVTEEFNDTEIRLKNARAVRARLEELLAKATKVEESIQIEKELERVAEQIDRLEGRIKFLRDRATYSTITVTFQPRSSAEIGRRPFNLPVP